MNIEAHESGEWTALYIDGKLDLVGDTYLADERIRELFNVTTVQDDAFMMGQDGREGVAQTLEELHAYQQTRNAKLAEAEELFRRAAELEAYADRLRAEARQRP